MYLNIQKFIQNFKLFKEVVNDAKLMIIRLPAGYALPP